jgi:hypothetical protein
MSVKNMYINNSNIHYKDLVFIKDDKKHILFQKWFRLKDNNKKCFKQKTIIKCINLMNTLEVFFISQILI